MWECWNSNCPNYAGAGVRLRDSDVRIDANGRRHCPYCNTFVSESALPPPPPSNSLARVVVGAGGGALLGAAIGGVPGALIGAFLGVLAGAIAGQPR